MKKYDYFSKALNNLNEGIKTEEPYSIVEQTGIIALFEICFEQTWKLMKEILERHGRIVDKIASPRSIIKIAYQCNMISDEQNWIKLLETRNILAHTYDNERALETIKKIKDQYLDLFFELKREIDDRWLIDIDDI